jgi:uncharacterized protein YjbI with pentapeptide repeats
MVRLRAALDKRRFTALGVTLASVAVATVVMLFYIQLPWWLDDSRLHQMNAQEQQTLIAADRGDALKFIAGLGGIVVVLYTARRHTLDRRALQVTQESLRATLDGDARSAELATEAQVTDRYTKAIGQLASDKPTERLGGIYALERIMNDSPKDHDTIVEVLAAFIRERAVAPFRGVRYRSRHARAVAGVDERRSSRNLNQQVPDADVQAALTVLGRRPTRHEKNEIDLHRTWLPGAHLAGARLPRVNFLGANLAGANLVETDLEEAFMAEACLDNARLYDARLNNVSLANAAMSGANLTGANLGGANLLGVRMIGANLTAAQMGRVNLFRARLDGADLLGAHLEEANLRAASLVGARLRGVYLRGAGLSETDLRDVRQLSQQRLARAWVDKSTLLPTGLRFDEASGMVMDEPDHGGEPPILRKRRANVEHPPISTPYGQDQV